MILRDVTKKTSSGRVIQTADVQSVIERLHPESVDLSYLNFHPVEVLSC